MKLDDGMVANVMVQAFKNADGVNVSVLQSEQQADHETAANAFQDASVGGASTKITKPLPDDGEIEISATGEDDKPKPPPPGMPGPTPVAPGATRTGLRRRWGRRWRAPAHPAGAGRR